MFNLSMKKKDFGFGEETKRLFRIEWKSQEEVVDELRKELNKIKKSKCKN